MLKLLNSKQQFDAFILPSEGKERENAKFVHFFAPWASSCAQLDNLLMELQTEYGQNTFGVAKIDAESLAEVTMAQKVTAVPTVIIFKNIARNMPLGIKKYIISEFAFWDGKIAGRVEGFQPAELKDWAVKCSLDSVSKGGNGPPTDKGCAALSDAAGIEDLNSRLKRLTNSARLTLFMKGTPAAPKCGFSRQTVDLLQSHNVDFWTFDILEDEQVRQGLKAYSDWPTYPQLYLDGELLGGLDVIREEFKEPSFVDKLPKRH